jgi:DNA polymerase III subunit beta
MKIICTQENLKNGLAIAGRIIGNTNTLPILNNVLLKTDSGLLYITSTNLEIGLRTQVRCKVEDPGEVCLPAKIISELVAALPSGNIEIETTDQGVEIRTDNYKTKIHSLPADEFPIIPHIERKQVITLPSQEFKKALESVIFAASTNETQPEISGVLFKTEPSGLRLVATDRYRLAEKQIPAPEIESREVIIPHRTVQEVIRIIGQQQVDFELILADTQLAVVLGETEIVSRLVDGQYPPYQQIIPDSSTTLLVVETQELLSALKTSGIFSRSNNSVVLDYSSGEKQVKISAASHDLGESTITVPAEITGESGVILLNHRYVIEALQNISDAQITVKIVNDSTAVIITPKQTMGYLYLVMPIKN